MTVALCLQTYSQNRFAKLALTTLALLTFVGWSASISLGQLSTSARNQLEATAKRSSTEFRIESKLYVADSKQPQTHNLTLFSQGVVYDFQRGPDPNAAPTEVVVYDSRTKMVALLELGTERKLELHDINLLKLLDAARREAEKNDMTRFLVHDTYKEEIDVSHQSVTLKGNNITYQFAGNAPKNERIMPIYFEFLDTFTRLQASDPRKYPPFPRIRLNQSIRRVGWIPSRVDVSIKRNALFPAPFEAHTVHELSETLAAGDRELIAEAKRKWGQFTSVSLAEYRGFRPTPMMQKLLRTAQDDENSTIRK